jgi:hypothetical protein
MPAARMSSLGTLSGLGSKLSTRPSSRTSWLMSRTFNCLRAVGEAKKKAKRALKDIADMVIGDAITSSQAIKDIVV